MKWVPKCKSCEKRRFQSVSVQCSQPHKKKRMCNESDFSDDESSEDDDIGTESDTDYELDGQVVEFDKMNCGHYEEMR